MGSGGSRDVKKTRPYGYQQVNRNREGNMGKILPSQVVGIGMGILNTRMLNGAGAEITIHISAGTWYKITILSLSYYLS